MAHKYLGTEIGNLKYAYSFKKVVSGYAGSCIKVRRDSDDTTSNIGFSGDDFDSSALTTFLSGANGYIDTWYDQTGTIDLVQATLADQPALVQEDSVWTAYFDGSLSTMQLANSGALTTATNSSLHVVWKNDLTNDTDVSGFQFGSTDQQVQPKEPGAGAAGGNYLYVQTKTAQEYISNGVWNDGKWRQHQVNFFNGTMECFEIGTDLGPSASKTNPDMAHFYVGGNDSVAADMYVTEVVWLDAVTEARDVWQVTQNNYTSTIFNFTDYILHVGDSLSSNQFSGLNSEWMQIGHEAYGTDRWNVRGDAGNTAAQWISEIGRIAPHGFDRYMNPSSGSKVVVLWVGTNDITGGATGSTTYDRIVTLAQDLKGYGYGGVIVMTCLPRTQTGVIVVTHETERLALNVALKANTSDFALVVDLATNANLEDETNGTYFQADQVHLTAAGAAEVGNEFESALTAASFNFSNYTGGNVGVTFGVRGDSIEARYSSEGKIPGRGGNNAPSEVTTDRPGINGTNSIDMAGTTTTIRPLVYVGRTNTPLVKPRSVLLRANFVSIGVSLGLFNMGGDIGLPQNYVGFYLTAAGEILFDIANDVGQIVTGTSVSSGIVINTWHDIVLTWTGDTTTNGIEIWVDGVRKYQSTSTRSLPTYDENQQRVCANLVIGADSSNSIENCYHYIDECVVWDEVIDPTSVTLTSGSGSLNGASRTAYVDVDEYDGSASAGGSASQRLGGFGF